MTVCTVETSPLSEPRLSSMGGRPESGAPSSTRRLECHHTQDKGMGIVWTPVSDIVRLGGVMHQHLLGYHRLLVDAI
jgi:hypothetical protein